MDLFPYDYDSHVVCGLGLSVGLIVSLSLHDSVFLCLALSRSVSPPSEVQDIVHLEGAKVRR